MAYSKDLRRRVVDYVESGHSRDSAARIFKLARATVLAWLKLNKTGGLRPGKRGPKEGKKRVGREAVLEYVTNNSDKTLKEMGEVFKVSHHTIWKILRKELGFSYKKKRYYIKKEMKKKGRIMQSR